MRLLEFIELINEDYELLFELRNVLNVEELKKFAEIQAKDLAQPFAGAGQGIYDMIVKWAPKAILKHSLTEMPGHDYELHPAGQLVVPVGGTPESILTMTMDTQPQWAQDALKRGEQLTWINWRDQKIAIEFSREVSMVRDWLRSMMGDPNLLRRTLSRVNWAEALRLSNVYHAELKARQERRATLEDALEWFMKNFDAIRAQAPQSAQIMDKLHEVIARMSGDYYEIGTSEWKNLMRSELGWAGVREVIGGGGLSGLIRAYEKNNKPKKVEMPEDDPEGLEPYLRYSKEGEKIEDDDFEPAPEIGPQWVKLKTSKCAEYEGNWMGHCVAGYGQEIEEGRTWIYSFRDIANEPHITIEVRPSIVSPEERSELRPGDSWTLQQIKGKGNEPPAEKYHPHVVDFLTKLSLQAEEGNVEVDIASGSELEAMTDLDKMDWLREHGGLEIPGPLGREMANIAIERTAYDIYKAKGMTRQLEHTIENYFSDQNEYDANNKGFILTQANSLQEFMDEHGDSLGHAVKHVMSVMDGEEYIDMEADPMMMRDLFDTLPKEKYNAIRRYLVEKYGDDPTRADDFDFTSGLLSIAEEEGDELYSAVMRAVETGLRYGVEADMVQWLERSLGDLESKYTYEGPMHLIRGDDWDSPVKLIAPEDDVAQHVQYWAQNDRENYGDDLFDAIQFEELEEPNYGWSGYDEDSAKEELETNLAELEIPGL